MADAPAPDMSMFGGGAAPAPDMSMFGPPPPPPEPSLSDTYTGTVKGAGHEVAQDFRDDAAERKSRLDKPPSFMEGMVEPFTHPTAAGGVLRPVKEAGDIFGAVTSPFLGGPNEVVRQITSPKPDPAVTKMESKLPWGAPSRGLDILQAVSGIGPETEAVELTGPVAGGAARPVTRMIKQLHGSDAPPSPAHQEIINRIAKGAKGGGPTAQDMLDLARKHPDKPLTLMDTPSRPVKALAGKVFRQGGEAGQRIGGTLETRNAGQGGRLEGDISKSLGAGSAHATETALKASRKAAASPLYTGAYAANPVVRSSIVDEVLRTKWGQAAWKAARDKTRIAAIKNRTTIPDKFSLETLDYTKQGLDDAASAARRAGHNGLARDIGEAKNAFLSELDEADHTGLYAKARNLWSGDSASIEAIDFGRDALKGTPEQNAETWAKLPAGDKEFAKLGLAQTLRDSVANMRKTQNAADRIANTEGLRRRIRPFFDSDEAFNKFFDAATAEDTMFRTRAEITGGSQTAERGVEDAGTDHFGHALNVGKHAASGNLLSAARHGARWVGDVLSRPKPEVAAQTADILTKPISHPATTRILRQILAAPAKPRPKVGAAPLVAPAALSADRNGQQ